MQIYGALSTTDHTLTGTLFSNTSVTGSDTTSSVSLTPTWNTTGSLTAMLLNVTNTASGAGSLLLDLQVGGVSLFHVDTNGVVTSNTPAQQIFQQANFGGF